MSSNTQDSICALILAAGKGTRMKSSLPKVLHPLAGRPVLSWVIKAVRDAGVSNVTLVLSPDTKPFESLVDRETNVRVVIQNNQKGTGDAVAASFPAFKDVVKPGYSHGTLKTGSAVQSEWTLVVTGDTPAISSQTLSQFVESTKASGRSLSVLGMKIPNPKGYGRLVQSLDGGLTKIVEERDADAETKKINLCNSGIIMAKTKRLFELLNSVEPHNAQGEYYLTDVFSISVSSGESAHVFSTDAAYEFLGVNDRAQLSELEDVLLSRHLHTLLTSGVTFHRAESCYVDVHAELSPDIEVYPNVTVLGSSKIGRGVTLGAGCVLDQVTIEDHAVIGANSVLTKARVKAGTKVPPLTVRVETDF